MTLIRGIKTLTAGYIRDFLDVPDTEENISACVVLESMYDNCDAIVANSWPGNILLNASITSVGVSSTAAVTRTQNSKPVGSVSLYSNPKIDSQSSIQNPKLCCSKIIINFDNSGKYTLENNSHAFVGDNFDNYKINFSSKHLFEKEFLICSEDISEAANQAGLLQYENAFVKCIIYPYGGVFEYGMHPKQIESCVFRTTGDARSLSLRVSTLSSLKSTDIDLARQLSGSSYKFAGHFSDSQKINLYDELKGGACKIEIENKNTNEKLIYKSDSVSHVTGTNLVSINFRSF